MSGAAREIVFLFDIETEILKNEAITEHKVKCHKQSKWFTGLVKCPVCGRSMIVYNSIFFKCIVASTYQTCDNKQTLKISELEEVLKGLDKSNE